ncbi:hypothetical protein QQ999_09240 [Pseudomonas fluorescens]
MGLAYWPSLQHGISELIEIDEVFATISIEKKPLNADGDRAFAITLFSVANSVAKARESGSIP